MRTRRMRLMAVAVAVGIAVAGTATSATAAGSGDSRGNTLRVQLSGYEEDPQAISTTGAGQFWAQVDRHGQTITFRLSYSGLVGNVTQAHIHFGGRAQSGGIVVFLCTNQGNGPAGTQACPAAPATVTGVITPATVIGPAGQGIAAGEFAEFVDAIRAGTTYANVHSSVYPAGEIRGQLGHH